MRCPECNKFVSMEQSDPEVSEEQYGDGEITANVRIVLVCAECTTELKETQLEISEEVDFCSGKDHEVTVDIDINSMDRREGKGRYSKTFYGAEGVLKLECSCTKSISIPWKDDCQASSMDELV